MAAIWALRKVVSDEMNASAKSTERAPTKTKKTPLVV